ncbi:uncharacterized protein C8Q71DRAFT_760471 [Rhodofomes roseus]|uniref:DUF6533 domain-containing protein n=1 Tax=Rhodofomes roseus TaxID=34475 RepID=A0ABQ8KEE7_9APHY|nr:uncharacterized protein C8Q71DRAFT_760471 [Rhodofomes roseus]KAH9836082.1 hypothetical protein C8Q71DRAFT_760471 [Rhodofomes roseus]
MLTFSREVRCIWKRRFSGATVLFMLNRYLTLVYRVLMTVEILPLGQNPNSGQAPSFRGSSNLIGQVGFTSLRMYAVWSKDRRIFAGILFLGLVPIGVNMFYYTKVAFVVAPPPLVGCADLVYMTPAAMGMFNCIFAITADTIVLILTCVKTFEIKRSFAAIRTKAKISVENLVQNRETSYVSLIQRDVDLIAIKNQAFGSLPALTEVLTSILISRFLLDLRSIYLASHGIDSNGKDSTMNANASTLAFGGHSVAGNLGAPLESMLSDPEERYELIAADEAAYISEDPLAMGLRSSPRHDHNSQHNDADEADDTGLRVLRQ